MRYQIKKIGRKGKPKRYYVYEQESKRVDGKVKTTTRYVGPLRRLFQTGVSLGMLIKHELADDRNLEKLKSDWEKHDTYREIRIELSQQAADKRSAILRERDPEYREQIKHAHFEQLKQEEIDRAREESRSENQRATGEEISIPSADETPGESSDDNFSVSGPTD